MRKLRFVFSSVFVVLTCAFLHISACATTYNIETDEDWLALCNVTSFTTNDVVNLLADIDLTNLSAYTDSAYVTAQFNGTFNGNGHIISNGSFTYSGSDIFGLFCKVTNAKFYDLIIKGCTFNAVGSSTLICGALVGQSGASTFSNIYSINNTFNVTQAKYLAGIVGSCFTSQSTFNYCYNFSDISINSCTYLSGITAYATYTSPKFNACANYGNLGITNLTVDSYVSGISSKGSSQVEYCYNLGNLYGKYISGIAYSSSSVISCYDYDNAEGYSNLNVAYSPITLHTSSTMPSAILRNYAFGNVEGFNNTTTALYSYVNEYADKANINQDLLDTLNNGYSVYCLDSSNINNGFPLHSNTCTYMRDVILPLVNGSSSGGSGNSSGGSLWSTLDGRAEGTYDSSTGKFEYNISVNTPDYSGILGDSAYQGGYTIPGTADDVGVDINDMSGLESIISTDFSNIFLAIPAIGYLLTLFLSSSDLILLSTFVLLLTLLTWFFGRKV